ncbi:hypothetical protein QQ008_04540 [Fulvivirgaceae bacterium BMA10]|uniref:Uncharacterized protein n=1 Tax=Splendidivirga corallicola TaxID=3051826 RepID=A0ABT8KIS4_9BACT|nr:hypothetical protein [Fulvivirgaceae bacterium BMA10]
MKNLLNFSIILFLITIFGCDDNVEIDKRIAIKYKDTEQFSALSIHFDEVIEDSRCREGWFCIWQGRYRVSLIISDGEKQESYIVTNLPKSPVDTNTVNFEDYTIELISLNSSPGGDKQFDLEDYILELRITRDPN